MFVLHMWYISGCISCNELLYWWACIYYSAISNYFMYCDNRQIRGYYYNARYQEDSEIILSCLILSRVLLMFPRNQLLKLINECWYLEKTFQCCTGK